MKVRPGRLKLKVRIHSRKRSRHVRSPPYFSGPASIGSVGRPAATLALVFHFTSAERPRQVSQMGRRTRIGGRAHNSHRQTTSPQRACARHDGDRGTRILSAHVHWMYALAPRGSESWLEERMQPRRIGLLIAALSAAYVAAGAVANLTTDSIACALLAVSDHDALDDRVGVLQGAAAQDDHDNRCGNCAVIVRDLLLAPAVRSDGGGRAGPPISGTARVSRIRCHQHRGGRHDRSGFFSEPPGVSISVDCVWR